MTTKHPDQPDLFKDYLPKVEANAKTENRDPLFNFRSAYEAFDHDYDSYDNAGANTQWAIDRNAQKLLEALGEHPLKDELKKAIGSGIPSNVYEVCDKILNPKSKT